MATNKAHAAPTKDFFVRMITKDISLEDCILDLIDNSLDGARKNDPLSKDKKYQGHWAKIDFSKDRFSIVDNCGGISVKEAVDYAFHFGRRSDAAKTGYSIGLYGIGMKRAIFKIGSFIKINSSTPAEAFETKIDVDEWLRRPPIKIGEKVYEDWDFDMQAKKRSQPYGTSINIEKVHSNIVSQLVNPTFENALSRIIGRDYAQFISKGFEIEVNGKKIVGLGLTVGESKDFQPIRVNYDDESGVSVEIIAGMSGAPPDDIGPNSGKSEADNFGWFVLCNDRVVIASDKTSQTGWGSGGMPIWHYQYHGFIGVVSFESDDPSLLPWRTTKRDVDESNPAYQRALVKMKEIARIWIKYTNDRRVDIEASKRAESLAQATPIFEIRQNAALTLPQRAESKQLTYSSIQYSKPVSDLARVKRLLGNPRMSNGRVGEKTFEYYLANEGED